MFFFFEDIFNAALNVSFLFLSAPLPSPTKANSERQKSTFPSALKLTLWLCNQWQSLKWKRKKWHCREWWMPYKNICPHTASSFKTRKVRSLNKCKHSGETILCHQDSLTISYHHYCFIKWHDIKWIGSAQRMWSSSAVLLIKYKKMLHKQKIKFLIMNFVCYTGDAQASFVNYFNFSNDFSGTLFSWFYNREWKHIINYTMDFNEASSVLRVASS